MFEETSVDYPIMLLIQTHRVITKLCGYIVINIYIYIYHELSVDTDRLTMFGINK